MAGELVQFRVPAEIVARWREAAEEAGEDFGAYIRTAVERRVSPIPSRDIKQDLIDEALVERRSGKQRSEHMRCPRHVEVEQWADDEYCSECHATLLDRRDDLFAERHKVFVKADAGRVAILKRQFGKPAAQLAQEKAEKDAAEAKRP